MLDDGARLKRFVDRCSGDETVPTPSAEAIDVVEVIVIADPATLPREVHRPDRLHQIGGDAASPTKRGKGTKLVLVTQRESLSVGLLVESA